MDCSVRLLEVARRHVLQGPGFGIVGQLEVWSARGLSTNVCGDERGRVAGQKQTPRGSPHRGQLMFLTVSATTAVRGSCGRVRDLA